MGIVNRFFLFLYALTGILLVIGASATIFPILPEHYVQDIYTVLMEQWEAMVAVLAVMFLLGIHFLVYSLMGNAQSAHVEKEVILIHGTSGDVKVAVEAVRSMIEKVARMVPGVREAKVRVQAARNNVEKETAVTIGIRLVIGQEENVTVISDAIRKVVGQHLEQTVGVTNFTLNIAVDGISNAAMTKKQRVV